MALFLYKAKKGPDQIIEGQIQAQSKQEASTKISSLGLFPLWIEEQRTSRRRHSKVSLKELVEFTHQLSTLINSGSTLLASLNTLVTEVEHTHLAPVIIDIVAQVKEGTHFSQAIEKYPHIFPQLYISLVRIGETSGTLGQNLKRIAQFLEEELDFRTNITSILTYPLLIVAVGILTVFALLKFVIPKIVNIFEEIGQELPLPTMLLKNVSDIFSRYWIFVIGFGVLFFFIIKKYCNMPHNRLKWSEFKLRLPLVGELLKKIEIARFARTLSILLRNGVAIDMSLKVLTATVSNIFFQKQISKIERDIKEGFSLNEAMKRIHVFPRPFINVITVGEESGTLDTVLDNISDDYNKEISRRIKTILTILEPLLILGIGLIVGFVVLAMLLPIFEIDFNF
jgi:type II secretory pathway component PulF